MPYKIQKYGWTRDLPDHRDHLYAAPPQKLAALPPSFDLRPQCPPVYDQGQLGSCTANAIAGAIQFDQMKQKLNPVFTPSRLFIYYNERAIEGTVASDSGAQIRDGVKSVGQQGDCPETEWPYDITKFAQKPPSSCYSDARKYKVVSYQRITQSLAQMRGCLASGSPFVFGFTVYQAFESPDVAKSGLVPLPGPKEQSIGGHAVMAVGYDDGSQTVTVRNSWGSAWGLAGYFKLPYAYIQDPNLASDFWNIQVVL
jgi:C1A family cysteine protease